MSELYHQALEAAQTCDVSTPPDSLVLYSVSFLPTKENKEQALRFIDNNPDKMMIDHTPCGEKLIAMGLDGPNTHLSDEETAHIWCVASKRLIEQARGNVTAFVKNADPRSVFRRMELPTILENPEIKTINGKDKYKFAETFR